jgi:hypothetical protein
MRRTSWRKRVISWNAGMLSIRFLHVLRRANVVSFAIMGSFLGAQNTHHLT